MWSTARAGKNGELKTWTLKNVFPICRIMRRAYRVRYRASDLRFNNVGFHMEVMSLPLILTAFDRGDSSYDVESSRQNEACCSKMFRLRSSVIRQRKSWETMDYRSKKRYEGQCADCDDRRATYAVRAAEPRCNNREIRLIKILSARNTKAASRCTMLSGEKRAAALLSKTHPIPSALHVYFL